MGEGMEVGLVGEEGEAVGVAPGDDFGVVFGLGEPGDDGLVG